ncbi:PH domain-containing protein [Nonomuraea sp. NPDC050310]|uniref:PH domain-containing protein n=1 Tax=Nonomuraea sp. NPDC050310 TaxID=3154935 RepID=UPI0033FF71A0
MSAEVAGTDWRGLDRRSLAASAVLSFTIVAPAVLVLVRIASANDWGVTPTVLACAGAGVLIVLGTLVYDLLRLRTTSWRLTGERLELRSGVAVRQHRSIPRERVRSVDLKADPVRRALGLAVVKVGTGEQAGGEHAELTLDPLTRQEAEDLRHALLLRAPATGAAGAAEHERPALAVLDWSWLRYAPLTVWSFIGAALVLGAAYKPLDALGLDEGLAESAWKWVTGDPWRAVPLILAVNVLAGAAGAAAVFATSWGRYRLEREPGRLRLSRGLLTTRSMTLEERRLRGVELAEPLLLRLGGGARVKVVTTGLRKREEKEADDVSVLTPPMPLAGALELAGQVSGSALPARLHGRPKAALHRRLRLGVVETVVLAGVAGLLDLWWLPAWIWLLPLVNLPIALLYARAEYRALGHALGERHLVSRQGVAARRTVALERRGIIGWRIKESYFQRRLGLITLTATTAAGPGHYDVPDLDGSAGLDLAARTVPGLLDKFLTKR